MRDGEDQDTLYTCIKLKKLLFLILKLIKGLKESQAGFSPFTYKIYNSKAFQVIHSSYFPSEQFLTS